MSIQQNYDQIKKSLPENVELVAVSKTHSPSEIMEVYQLGQRVFGENKVQELVAKQPELPKDIKWHLIGHLQRNKVKYIAEFIDTIESVDSQKLLLEIDKRAAQHKRKINILLQIKIAEEDSKTGMEMDEAVAILEQYKNGEFPNVKISGVMGIATFTEDESQVEKEFLYLKKSFETLSEIHPMTTISMGMSGDYPLAIACGSNCVRIGSSIFGARDYSKK